MSIIVKKEFDGVLRRHMVRVPEVISQAPGIFIFGRHIRSLIFSTDVAIIKNNNADAVIAVYPFTPLPIITEAVMKAADKPVFSGVGGGITRGDRVVDIAKDAEFRGAIGVVLNAPTPNETIVTVSKRIDIPVVITVVRDDENFKSRLDAGAAILNVSGASKTADIVKRIKDTCPEAAVLATGGPTEESIYQTIQAGADAITYTPPPSGEIFRSLMDKYRDQDPVNPGK